MSNQARGQRITGGVDTHKDSHTAAALDESGRLLGVATFGACPSGYRRLLQWLTELGSVDRVGIEGTGSYGSGLTRFLLDAQVDVVEVQRPKRQLRRRRGKSDPVDAEAAARAALSREETGVPKAKNSNVEVLRMLRLQRASAIKARTQAANQLHAVVLTSPEPVRSVLRDLSLSQIICRARRFRRVGTGDLEKATRGVLKGLARRWHQLDREVAELDRVVEELVRSTAPQLLALQGVGIDVASTLLVTAGDNPKRLANECSFAAMCGVSPVDASSGKQRRHRLNRGGNRDANRALWIIAMVRMRLDSKTRTYVDRRTAEGLSKREIIRCLKRYISREVFQVLRQQRPARQV